MSDPICDHFRQLADYNQWANRRLYRSAAVVGEADLHKDIGVYFSSLFGTLKHLIQTDRAWQCLLNGRDLKTIQPVAAGSLAELQVLREIEDQNLIALVDAMTETGFEEIFEYIPWSGPFANLPYRQKRRAVLTHLFNHHTHHRGQAHAALTILGIKEPAPLDLFVKHIAGHLDR